MARCERFIVSGRVQGVGFRYATLQEARRLGVTGWVRNLPDGQVEVLAQADAPALERFATWLRRGPPGARVTDLERLPAPDADAATRFEIT